MSPNVAPFPGMGPQLQPTEDRKQHCMYKYKHAHELTYVQRQEHRNTSANSLSFLLLTSRNGHAHTLLPDITAHSCVPRALAISSPQKPRLTSATFHSLPKPQGQLHSWALSWAVRCLPPPRLSPITSRASSPSVCSNILHTRKQNVSFFHPLRQRLSCSCFHRLTHSFT